MAPSGKARTAAAPQAPRSPFPPAWRVALANLSGVLVVLAFPLFGSEVGLDGLIWVALTPLFLAAVGAGPRRGAFLGWLAGLAIEGAGFIWILLAVRRFTAMPWPLASAGFFLWALYSSVPWALLGTALGACSRPASVLWVLPFWVGLEHGFPRLFPWHLGGALHRCERLLQTVDVWGASGLTALVFLSGACAYFLILWACGRARLPWRSALALGALLGGSWLYGNLRFEAMRKVEAGAPALQVVLIQGALHPLEKTESSLDYYLGATRRVLRDRRADLVVWPEGAAQKEDWPPFDLDPKRHNRRDLWLGKDLAGTLRAEAAALGTPIAAGGTGFLAGRIPAFSNVLAYAAPGRPVRFYEKNHRLFLGEKVPFLDLLPSSWRESLGLHVGTVAAGVGNPVLSVGDARFRSLICYEATLPGYVAAAAADVDFLVNITEDIWYGRTAQIPQHVSVLRLRVVENRTPLVRCTNIGPSGVFDICGAFRHGERVLEAEEVVLALRAASVQTLYGKGGRHLPAVLLLGALARGFWAWRRRRS